MLKVNEYFGGNVKSIGFKDSLGEATVGVMAAGDYEFGTSSKEIMTVVTGELKVKMPREDTWKVYAPGDKFEVEANVKFNVAVKVPTSYLCQYK